MVTRCGPLYRGRSNVRFRVHLVSCSRACVWTTSGETQYKHTCLLCPMPPCLHGPDFISRISVFVCYCCVTNCVTFQDVIWRLHKESISRTIQFSSVQSHSRVQLFAIPCTAACQASLSITNSRSSLKLMSIPVGDAIQLSHPLLSPSPPTFNLSQHQGLFK